MALSNAERQRRFITRLKEQAKAGAPGRIRELEDRIRKLEAELARERKRRAAAEAKAARR